MAVHSSLSLGSVSSGKPKCTGVAIHVEYQTSTMTAYKDTQDFMYSVVQYQKMYSTVGSLQEDCHRSWSTVNKSVGCVQHNYEVYRR